VKDQVLQILYDEMRWAGQFLVPLHDLRTAIEAGTGNTPATLDHIRQSLDGCDLCPLSRSRNKLVFGEGNPDADIMFIGEAPGAVEDETGRPFVGPAGSLLTDIIEKGMRLKRQDVYIANILKCRPPGNRDPNPEEIGSCIKYLEGQLLAVNPRVIILLGRIAAHTLLETTTPISRLRGTFSSYKGIRTMPTFHPSYLLQNPSKKREVWEDIKKVMEFLDMPLR
jgi:DNA polymerase